MRVVGGKAVGGFSDRALREHAKLHAFLHGEGTHLLRTDDGGSGVELRYQGPCPHIITLEKLCQTIQARADLHVAYLFMYFNHSSSS